MLNAWAMAVRMRAAGCRLLYPLCQLAVMGVIRVLLNVHVFLWLLWQADRFFRRERPDAVVLIDYPGFNWWLRGGLMPMAFRFSTLCRRSSGPGRVGVRKMRRSVGHVLCSLPFEEAWYRERGVNAHYVGHPYFDELPSQKLDEEFLSRQQAQPQTLIGLLPGSRTQEVEHNLSTLIGAAAVIHSARPDTRFLVACYKTAHANYVRNYLQGRSAPYIEVSSGRTTEILHLADSCIAVWDPSGSRSSITANHRWSSIASGRRLFLVRRFKKSRFISLVNLLAGKELFPEFLTSRCEAAPSPRFKVA